MNIANLPSLAVIGFLFLTFCRYPTAHHLKQGESVKRTLKRIFKLLTPQERKRSALVLLIIFTNSFVDILGLAAIAPVITLVINPKEIESEWYLQLAFSASSSIGIETPSEFLVFLCVLMILAFLFKAFFGLGASFFQSRFSFQVAHRLSGMMWDYHFSQSLDRMRSNQSGQILAEINAWPSQFAQSFMIGGLLVISELMVLGVISLGLLAFNPEVFISVLVLLGIGVALIRMATQKRLSYYSDARKKLEPYTNNLVTDSILGFLEVITFRASSSIRNAYLKERWIIFRIQSNTTVLNVAPSKLYEVLAVSAIALSIILTLLQGAPDDKFLQLLTFMALSGYRAMPSMSRINVAIMQMRSQAYVLDTIEKAADRHNNFYEESASMPNPFSPEIDIVLQNVSLGYESLEKPVITRLSHTFRHGKVHGIVGPSGSGKSTLINGLLGLHNPINGEISLSSKGEPPVALGTNYSTQQWLQSIGYLSQKPFLFHGTVSENLTMRVKNATINEAKVHALIDELDLRVCLGPSPLEFIIEEGGTNLSGGQQQRLALLRALHLDRPVLFLDEATSALDDRLKEVVFNLLRKQAEAGCNVILVTHDAGLSAKCDNVLNLHQ